MLFSMFKLPPVYFIDRATGKTRQEEIYGEWGLALLYSSPFGRPLRWIFSKWRWLSRLYGWLQKRPASVKKVQPFIEQFGVDATEFAPAEFKSFNDFFIRKLKPEVRPIDDAAAVCPADGRYTFWPNVRASDTFLVKGETFSLAPQYEGGAMVMARLCPTDYHRFHFPVDGVAGRSTLVDGPLASVNPVALNHNIEALAKNKQMITVIETEQLGRVTMIEVGATNVGSIVQTRGPGPVRRGEEKGYFEFGGSAVLLLFEPGKIAFADDLIELSASGLEILCRVGQNLSSQ